MRFLWPTSLRTFHGPSSRTRYPVAPRHAPHVGARWPSIRVSVIPPSGQFDCAGCRQPACAVCRHTAFSSQPASSTSTAVPLVFLTVNRMTVTGRLESDSLSGMNGENASSSTTTGNVWIAVLDLGNRVLTAKSNVVEAAAIKCSHDLVHADTKPLIERRSGLHGFRIVGRPSADLLVEDVPVPESAIASQIQLTRTQAADRHADPLEFRPGIRA